MTPLIYFLLSIIGTPVVLNIAESWAPDEFTINSSTYLPDNVWNASYPRSVLKLDDETISMDSATTAVFSSAECTQYFFEFTPLFNGSMDFTVLFRTTRQDYVRNPQNGIKVHFRNDSMIVTERGSVVASLGNVQWTSGRERLLIENFANDWRITKACTELARGTTELPATDGVIVQTSNHTSMYMRNIVRNLSQKWWNKMDPKTSEPPASTQRASMFNLPAFRTK